MVTLDDLTRQHDTLADLVGDLIAALQPETLVSEIQQVRHLLDKLESLLRVHLAFEDEILYPALAESSDCLVRETAQRFREEMGGLNTAFGYYIKSWAADETILNEPRSFVVETQGIASALKRRIDKEDNELFVLVGRSGTAGADCR